MAVPAALPREFDRFEKQVRAIARCDTRARLLMSVPGVGAIVSLTFAAATGTLQISEAKSDPISA